jgi:glycosyltransferase involved in cell wall biosynthesis
MSRPKILVVSYAYPSAQSSGWGAAVGGERMRQFVRHLPEHGIDPVVLTHAGLTAAPSDDGVYAASDVVRRMTEWTTSHAAADRGAPREGWRVNRLRTRLRRWVIPDRASYAWAPFAIAAGLQLARRERPQLVLSSSPPMAAHEVGCLLAQHWGVPWVADVRDSFEPPEGAGPLAPLRRRVEKALYSQASRVIAVSDALRNDLRVLTARDDNVLTITNGYDRDDFAQPSAAGADPAVHELLYAGSTSFGAGRNLDRLLEAADQFATRLPQRVRVRLLGLFAPEETARKLAHAELDVTGWQERAVVTRSMQAANVLVVLTGNHASVATTKLFEYIGAGRPILVVGRASAAARIVQDGGFGVVADDTTESIANALRALHTARAVWDTKLQSAALREARVRYSRQAQARVLAAVVHDLLG